MNKEAYPAWIDDYARMMHTAFSHMVPADWGPLHFMDAWREVNGTFIEKLHETIVILRGKGVLPEHIAAAYKTLSPSTMRIGLMFLFYEWQLSDHTKKTETLVVTEYLLAALPALFKRDLWCEKENIVHTDSEVTSLLEQTPMQTADASVARTVARLGNAASALSYSLYRDFFMMISFDVLGPYDISQRYGTNHVYVIRTYPNLRASDLWPEMSDLEYNTVNLHLVYENVSITCELIGAHTLYKGDTIQGLREWAVEVDGEFITDLEKIKLITNRLGEKTVEHWALYEKMLLSDIELKFLEWMGYSLKPMFHAAGMDWRPTENMKRALVGREIRERLIVPSVPPFDEFVRSTDWEVYWLKKLYEETL